MAKSTRQLDTSGELIIQRWGNGIKLVKPHPSLTDSEHSVANVLSQPFNICFLNTESVLQNMSEECAEVCGMESVANFIGKNALNFTKIKYAERLFANDKNVLDSNRIRIFDEETGIITDKRYYQFISIKSPWYDTNNKIIGIFNYAVALGKQALEESLTITAKLGLLDSLGTTTQDQYQTLGSKIDNAYLSSREMQCLRLYVRGKTAKNIAIIFGLSRRTVEHYLENIKRKLCVSSKNELIEKTVDYFS